MTETLTLPPRQELDTSEVVSVHDAVNQAVELSQPDHLRKVGNQLGSNEGGWYEDEASGERYYAKFYPNPDQARTEYIANRIYHAAGIKAPTSKLVTIDGRLAIANAEIPQAQAVAVDAQRASSDVRDGFVADAFLMNWDVVGEADDNIVESSGGLYRCDNGGSLIFRARGGNKEFTPHSIDELWSMRDAQVSPNAAKVFAGLTEEDISRQAKALAESVSIDDISRIVEESGLRGEAAKAVREGLIGRRNVLALTQEQRQALEVYSGNAGHQQLVHELNQGYASPTARAIDDAMLCSVLKQDTVVYRAEGPQPTSPNDFPPGVSEPYPSYISTTLDETIAMNWRSTATVSRIVLPAGTPVAVPNVSEAEILLPRESVLETVGAVRRVKPNSSPLTYVEKRLLPGSSAIDEARQRQQAREQQEARRLVESAHLDMYESDDPDL